MNQEESKNIKQQVDIEECIKLIATIKKETKLYTNIPSQIKDTNKLHKAIKELQERKNLREEFIIKMLNNLDIACEKGKTTFNDVCEQLSQRWEAPINASGGDLNGIK